MPSILNSLVDASKRAIPTAPPGPSASTTAPIPRRYGDSRDIGGDWENVGIYPPSTTHDQNREDDVVSLDGDGKTREDALAEQKELEDLRERCKALEIEKKNAKEARIKDKEETSRLRKELEALRRERNELVAEKGTLREDLDRLTVECNTEVSRVQELQTRLDKMREENAALSRAKAKLLEENEALDFRFTEECNASEMRCQSLEKQLSATSQLKDELFSTKETLVWLTDQLKAKTQEIEEFNECFRVLEAIILGTEANEGLLGSSMLTDNAKRLCVDLKKRLDEQESARRHYAAMSMLKDNIEKHLNGRISNLSEELQKRDAALADAQAACSSLEKENGELEASKRNLKERLEKRKRKYDSVVEKLSQYERVGFM